MIAFFQTLPPLLESARTSHYRLKAVSGAIQVSSREAGLASVSIEVRLQMKRETCFLEETTHFYGLQYTCF